MSRRCIALADASDTTLAMLQRRGDLHPGDVAAVRLLRDMLRIRPTEPPARPAHIRVGGPPTGARWVRRVRVLAAAPVHGCSLPGNPRKARHPHRRGSAPVNGQAAPARWTHVAHHAAIAEAHAARLLQRDVLVFEHHDLWHVQVHDGWGRPVDGWQHHARDHAHAREVANRTWSMLRRLADEEFGLWRLA